MSLSPERWHQVADIFQAAIAVAGTERAAHLDRTCGGDDELRREVEALLAQDDRSVGVLDTPPLASAFLAPIAPGTRLGPYEIAAPLGAGGMGEVYRALDPRLGRTVAIKIVSSAFAGSAESRQRFEREARAVAALSHPHICPLFDVGRHEGVDYLVMECLEGETLATRLQQGPLPVDDVVRHAIEIASALDAAHRAGIVHRDLKPGNIMLTRGGATLLDFGIATHTTPQADDDAPRPAGSAVPRNVAPPLTSAGTIAGTINYMAPERLAGTAGDVRSDVFAFGAVVFEMTTGRKPFAGDSRASTIAAILECEPPPLTTLQPLAPAGLALIVSRCLRKDPDDRAQTAHDLVEELTTLQRAGPSPPARVTSRRRVWLTVAAGVVVIGLALAGRALLDPRRTSPSATAFSLEAVSVVRLTTSGKAERPAISPDGTYVAYVQHDGDDDSLWIRHVATASNVQIVGAAPGVSLLGATVTPDGNFVDFVRLAQGPAAQIWRVSFLGGPSRLLVDNVSTAVDWSPDGRQMAFVRRDWQTRASHVVVADADGHQQRSLVTLQRPLVIASLAIVQRPNTRPVWSPDGRALAFAVVDQGRGAIAQLIYFVSADSGAVLTTVPVPSPALFESLAWLSGDTLVLNHRTDARTPRQLWRLSYPEGRISRLTNDINEYEGVSLSQRRESLVTARSETRTSIWLGDHLAAEGTDIVPLELGGAVAVGWLRDRIVYDTTKGAIAIVSVSPSDGTRREIMTNAYNPIVAPDGRTIVYQTAASADRGLWKIDADGGAPVRVTDTMGILRLNAITRDGRFAVFTSMHGGQQVLWRVPLAGGPPTEVLKEFAYAAAFSPDGTSMAFGSVDQRTRSTTLVVCDFPACRSRQIFPLRTGILHWTPDGRGVAYVDRTGRNIAIQPLNGAAPYQLTHFADRLIGDFAWSQDGKQLAVVRGTKTSDIVLFEGLNR